MFDTRAVVRRIRAGLSRRPEAVGRYGQRCIDPARRFHFNDAVRVCEGDGAFDPFFVEDPVRDEHALINFRSSREYDDVPLHARRGMGPALDFNRLVEAHQHRLHPRDPAERRRHHRDDEDRGHLRDARGRHGGGISPPDRDRPLVNCLSTFSCTGAVRADGPADNRFSTCRSASTSRTASLPKRLAGPWRDGRHVAPHPGSAGQPQPPQRIQAAGSIADPGHADINVSAALLRRRSAFAKVADHHFTNSIIIVAAQARATIRRHLPVATVFACVPDEHRRPAPVTLVRGRMLGDGPASRLNSRRGPTVVTTANTRCAAVIVGVIQLNDEPGVRHNGSRRVRARHRERDLRRVRRVRRTCTGGRMESFDQLRHHDQPQPKADTVRKASSATILYRPATPGGTPLQDQHRRQGSRAEHIVERDHSGKYRVSHALNHRAITLCWMREDTLKHDVDARATRRRRHEVVAPCPLHTSFPRPLWLNNLSIVPVPVPWTRRPEP